MRFLRPIMTGTLILLLAALGCAALAGCSGETTGTIMVVTEADDGTTVSIAKGQELSVQLPANPSTGYSWVASDTPQFLALQGEPTFETGAPDGVVGAGGTQTTVFVATATGTGKLMMDYVRPWESGVKPEKTFSVTIEAQ